MFSRDQLKRAASLTEEDFVQLGKCRRPHSRLGFAYQVGFVRLLLNCAALKQTSSSKSSKGCCFTIPDKKMGFGCEFPNYLAPFFPRYLAYCTGNERR
jgi:hypothetical protein